MRDLLPQLAEWQAEGETICLASVIATSSTVPLPPGSALGLHPDGRVVGSVSGGCVEADVAELASEVLLTSRPVRRRYGITDVDAVEVGLTCGGSIEVLVRSIDPTHLDLASLSARVADGQSIALATVVEAADHADLVGHALVITSDLLEGTTRVPSVDVAIAEAARAELDHDAAIVMRIRPGGQQGSSEVVVFVQSFARPPRMIVFGATDFASATASVGRFLGYRVTVCDARPTFVTRARFPQADELIVDWPHRYLRGTEVDGRTVLCVMTHDPKFDLPLLEVALRSPAAYVGALGSRRTVEARRRELLDRGVAPQVLARLRSPTGLDLGGSTPQETAISIAAEIIASRCQGSGRPLSERGGAIHRQRDTRDLLDIEV